MIVPAFIVLSAFILNTLPVESRPVALISRDLEKRVPDNFNVVGDEILRKRVAAEPHTDGYITTPWAKRVEESTDGYIPTPWAKRVEESTDSYIPTPWAKRIPEEVSKRVEESTDGYIPTPWA